ncbi:hypothetical protein [Marinomonas sp. TW1]|uniref:hypothetical protein n=1 Tax=Marinomonas sp. TW1 TaxID=1561203 RepID=UPI0007AEFF53|nr:hypothetical protein [Marinomonas sp. TW1]KZN15316.1 hypothetical protein OA79_00545 [Marinomonas sp. TW1]
MTRAWLPDLVLFNDYDGDWNRYLNAIYTYFKADFVISKPIFRGVRLGLKRYPEYDGKSATFWHMTSTGDDESERIPDFRRCERIRWPKPIIENDQHSSLKVWAELKGKNKRIHIWYEQEGYLVVLDDRGDYILPWTAFYVEREHERRKYNKRWERNKDNV